MEREKKLLKGINDCVGCGACMAICPRGAISKKVTTYTWVPYIDEKLCVNCGACQKVCNSPRVIHDVIKQAYIAYNSDPIMRIQSASGGVFSAIATYVLQKQGSVFGAHMSFVGGEAFVEHLRVTDSSDLPLIMGSKYVQSDSSKVYREVKDDLINGKKVLFSGCSCQISGLKNYLKNIDQSNLYTMDLICHGVPIINFFNKYIKWLEKKHNGTVTGVSFRSKQEREIRFELTIEIENSNKIVIPLRDSGYYRMFFNEENYRNSCYNCEYASLEKPADITIGDYFEAIDDYPELFVGKDAIDCSGGISCMVVHTEKGKNLLKEASSHLILYEVDPKVVQSSHGNLHQPSRHSMLRTLLKMLHTLFGYGIIEFYYKQRNKLVDLIKNNLKAKH